jgi:hypothetical protein
LKEFGKALKSQTQCLALLADFSAQVFHSSGARQHDD